MSVLMIALDHNLIIMPIFTITLKFPMTRIVNIKKTCYWQCFYSDIIHSAKSFSFRSVHCEAKDLMARTKAKLILNGTTTDLAHDHNNHKLKWIV